MHAFFRSKGRHNLAIAAHFAPALSRAPLFKQTNSFSYDSFSLAYCWALPKINLWFSHAFFFLASSSYFFANAHRSFLFLFFSTDSGTTTFAPSVPLSLLNVP
ncbi:hypothetical protein BHE74_00054021 [Ensete ventricosum]|nr:hypothetical protein BHE74_00054021 [Ensete ventricosum]RZS20842.1 hypothetical protein BHM03_00053406 [Ensete ventricosum]